MGLEPPWSVNKRFGAMAAVDEVTLTIAEGEIFGLLGPNGAGKSTTLKMLTMLLPPTAGTAQIDGFDLIRQASEVRRVIGYVPQALSADGSLTGYENLLIFARLYDLRHRYRKACVRDALAYMGLADAGDRLARHLLLLW
jgi:ABC-2 type transport system ATP-binding protein